MAEKTAPLAIKCDIDNWNDLDVWYRAHLANNFMALKGFCVIRSDLDRRVKQGAQREARKMRKESALTRVPKEALSSLLGETASCWTKDLYEPEDGAEPVVPPQQQSLGKVDSVLHGIGMELAGSAHIHTNLDILGRLRGVLHHSKMPEDQQAPQLIDLDEATEYMQKATMKKVFLLYFLGPSPATLTITPRAFQKSRLEVTIKEPVIIAARSDVIKLSYATRGFAISVTVDFVARMRAGLREGPRDTLPLPEDLSEWYDHRLKRTAEEGTEEGIDFLPPDFVRDAKLSYFAKEPISVRQVWYDLPAKPVPGESCLTRIQAAILGGQDVVTEIASPASKSGPARMPLQMPVLTGTKWDISEYYDADPATDAEMKVYTKHLSVLCHDRPDHIFYGLPEPFLLQDFGLTSVEDDALDHRARMLYEAHYGCHTKCCMKMQEISHKEMGFFVGISGVSLGQIFSGKVNKHTYAGMSHATMVSRLPYYYNSKGPAQAIDAEDASGACALQNAVKYLLGPSGEHGPFAFASAASYIDGPLETIAQCAAGIISPTGRSRVFDESSDGFVKGEGVVCFMLEPMFNEDGKNVCEPIAKPTFSGSALNSKGQSASLTAPSGPAIIDVVRRAARDATIPFGIVDAVEVNATGQSLADLMELGAMRSALDPDGPGRIQQAVPLRAVKATYGNIGAPSGLVAVLRTCFLLERALHGPNLHLHQLFDTSALAGDGEEDENKRRMLFLTEVIESKSVNQFVGVSSFGISGTNVHHVLWGAINSEHNEQYSGKDLTWWPKDVGREKRKPLNGYYIIGTMTAWEKPILMENEGEGVHGYTFTMGENNWETFQIWADGDQERVLHPTEVRACKDTKVLGPDSGIDRDLCWLITGFSRSIRLINQDQYQELQEENQKGLTPPMPEQDYAVAFKGGTRPYGYENAAGPEEMPLTVLNQIDAGKPGDKYRIRLHVHGKFYRVEWTKAAGLEALMNPEEKPYVHEYKIIGDHSYWLFEPMTPDSSEPGLYTAEIHLLKENSSFQIYRDGDWEQGFYPAKPVAGFDAAIQGPDEQGHGLNWQVKGKVGDIYRIQWRRRVTAEDESRSISWEYVRHEEVDFLKLAKTHNYFLVGTWSDFKDFRQMRHDEEGQRYSLDIRVGGQQQESFQILLNNNWLSAVHPSFNDASTFNDDGHTTEGPDDDGAGKYWTVGLHPEEGVTFGDSVTIHMDMSNGLPSRVWWETKSDLMTHQLKLAHGCKNIFYRHCRLLGIPPFATPVGMAPLKKKGFLPEDAEIGTLFGADMNMERVFKGIADFNADVERRKQEHSAIPKEVHFVQHGEEPATLSEGRRMEPGQAQLEDQQVEFAG